MTSPQKRPFSHLPPSLVTIKTMEFAILNNRSHRFLEVLLTSLPPSTGDVIFERPLRCFHIHAHTRLFIKSLSHSLFHLHIHSFTLLFFHLLTRPFTCSLTHSLVLLLIHSFKCGGSTHVSLLYSFFQFDA